jgi:Rod binding domain-containing protein
MRINPAQLGSVRPLKPTAPAGKQEQVAAARELKQAFTDFVGKTFFSEMLKSMRSIVDKPAYFHGGQTEEIFRSQLDHHLADRMTDASADRFAEPMFRQQFPKQAALLAAEGGDSSARLSDLSGLRRR